MAKKLQNIRIIERNIAGALICSNNGKYLLGKSQSGASFAGAWCILGGGIEKNESQEEAIIREVAEESGIDISKATLQLASDARMGESKKTLKTGEEVIAKMRFFDFKVTLHQNSQDIKIKLDKREWSDMKWYDPKEIAMLKLSVPTKLLLEQLEII